MEKPFLTSATQKTTSANQWTAVDVRLPERQAKGSRTDCGSDTHRTVIRGESSKKEYIISGGNSQAALTDWLNISFPFHFCKIDLSQSIQAFLTRFSLVTNKVFGGLVDQERGLHGWQHSYHFDHGGVKFEKRVKSVY